MTMDPSRNSPDRHGYFRRLVGLLTGAALFWTGAAIVNLLAFLFLPFVKRPRVRKNARRILRWLFRFWRFFLTQFVGVRFEIPERGRLNEINRTIVVVNHPSLMDAFYLLSVIPNAVCIFKESLQRNPLLGPLAHLCGFIANEAGPDMIREAGGALADGCNLIIFPEGTRSRDELRPFKPGFALIATRFKAPVQIIHLQCLPPLFPGRVNLQGMPATRPLVSIRMGRLFPPVEGRKATELMELVETRFRQFGAEAAVG
jgi:1-acyl-sn-glycerol-3-phosphate acyltransferase